MIDEGKSGILVLILKRKTKQCYKLSQLEKHTINFIDIYEICYTLQFPPKKKKCKTKIKLKHNNFHSHLPLTNPKKKMMSKYFFFI